jgi:hypothetical protein
MGEQAANWDKNIAFEPLLEALQEAIDRHAWEKAKYPGDPQEYERGYIDGLIRGKQLAGFHSQIHVQEKEEMKAKAEMGEAERVASERAWAAVGHDWERDVRFKPLLDSIQEAIDRNARERAQYPKDHPEYKRGYGWGLDQARGMSGYHSQLNVQIKDAASRLAKGEAISAEDILLVSSPQAKREMAQAEARLAAGDVRDGAEVRRRHASRFERPESTRPPGEQEPDIDG